MIGTKTRATSQNFLLIQDCFICQKQKFIHKDKLMLLSLILCLFHEVHLTCEWGLVEADEAVLIVASGSDWLITFPDIR